MCENSTNTKLICKRSRMGAIADCQGSSNILHCVCVTAILSHCALEAYFTLVIVLLLV